MKKFFEMYKGVQKNITFLREQNCNHYICTIVKSKVKANSEV